MFLLPLLLLILLPTASSMFFDLLGGFNQQPVQPTCVCSPPPCSASAAASSSSSSGFGGPYGGPSSYLGSYVGGGSYPGGGSSSAASSYSGGSMPYQRYPYRSRRATQVKPSIENGQDEQCSSEAMQEILRQGMTTSLTQSRERVRRSLLTHFGRETIVVCSPHQLIFSITGGADFCSYARGGFACHAFVI
ncbi:hypothetical protein Q1695_007564 [Nippostrongylus brasiliensis]|nr:hypothetical protein Q1695_007564 [Nippostrongylus brasiliensis]